MRREGLLLRLDPRLKARLRRAARRERRSQTAVLVLALERYLGRAGSPAVRYEDKP